MNIMFQLFDVSLVQFSVFTQLEQDYSRTHENVYNQILVFDLILKIEIMFAAVYILVIIKGYLLRFLRMIRS